MKNKLKNIFANSNESKTGNPIIWAAIIIIFLAGALWFFLGLTDFFANLPK